MDHTYVRKRTPSQVQPGDGEQAEEDSTAAAEQWNAPPGEVSANRSPAERSYRTGTEYPAPGEAPGPAAPEAPVDDLGDGPLPAADSEDIYGEADAPYTEEDEVLADAPPLEEGAASPLDKVLDDDDEVEPTRAGPPQRLEVISGPDEGRRKRFNGVRMVVGRVPDCDFVLSDQSVSRRHLELVQGGQGVLLRDLGSGNGSKVNGEKVAEKLLVHGDEISIGKTRFRFVDELKAQQQAQKEAAAVVQAERQAIDAEEQAQAERQARVDAAAAEAMAKLEGRAPPDPVLDAAANGPADGAEGADPAQAARPTTEHLSVRAPLRRALKTGWAALDPTQRAIAVIGALTILVLSFIVLGVARKPAPSPVQTPRETQAAEKMQMARSALRAERFDEAILLIDQAEKLQPGIDTSGFKVLAQKELEVQQGLEKVRAMIVEGKLDEASTALAALPEPTSAARGTQVDDLRRLLEGKRTEALQNALEAALAQKDLEKAQQIFEKLPPSKREELEATLEKAKRAIADDQKDEQRRVAVVAEANRRRSKAEREAFLQEAFAGVARKFNSGEFQRAVLECDRVDDQYRADPDVRQRAADLRKLIPAFERDYEDGQRKYKAGTLEPAARPLRHAHVLYTQIHFPGALGGVIDEELAAAALAAGRAAHARGDLASAAVNYREALKLNPNEEIAREGLQRLSRSAEELYLEAYMLKDRDPREALGKLRVVLEAAEPGSPVYEKARKQVQELAPQ
jgi:pSer/pThr/pTyr-binding forkhead associated (FHA) protein